MKRNPNISRNTARTFVIRLIADEEAPNALRGQISEPASDEGWQATFANTAELWALMRERLGLRRKISHSKSKLRTDIQGRTYE